MLYLSKAVRTYQCSSIGMPFSPSFMDHVYLFHRCVHSNWQAYTNELENKVLRLEEENERLKKQKVLSLLLSLYCFYFVIPLDK